VSAEPQTTNEEPAGAAPEAKPDGLPIEEWPGWDAARGVFILDRSRTKAREAVRRRRAPVRHTDGADSTTGQRVAG